MAEFGKKSGFTLIQATHAVSSADSPTAWPWNASPSTPVGSTVKQTSTSKLHKYRHTYVRTYMQILCTHLRTYVHMCDVAYTMHKLYEVHTLHILVWDRQCLLNMSMGTLTHHAFSPHWRSSRLSVLLSPLRMIAKVEVTFTIGRVLHYMGTGLQFQSL